jgi:excisionase family DNA binding protein
MSGMLTSKDLQELLQVDRSTIYRMAEAGALPAVKVGRQWRFPEVAIRSWLARGKQADSSESTPERLAFASLIKPAMDVMAETLGVMLVLTDMEGIPLTEVSNPCGLFSTVAAHPGGVAECIAGWQELAGSTDLGPRFTPSYLGLMCARAFIRSGAELTSMVIAGGIAPEVWPPEPSKLAAMAEGFDVDPSHLAAHVHEVHRLDVDGRQRVLDTLPRVASMVPEMTAEFRSLKGRLEAIAALTTSKEQTT